MFASYCAVQYVSVVKYALRSVNKGKSITLHAIAKAEKVLERGTVGPNVVRLHTACTDF